MIILPVLVSVAFITLAERKILRLTGRRQGPNKVSLQGILQPLADALKLANKSVNTISNFSIAMYYISVIIIFSIALIAWSRAPIFRTTVRWKIRFLVIILILGVSSMKAIIAGWRTYGKYSLIGRMRTVSQIISYESVLYLCILTIIWITKGFNIKEISYQEIIFMLTIFPLIFYFWLPSVLAELNRTPYDFSEGERELVRGFNTEFGSKSFTLIFLREYRNIIFFLLLTITLFVNQKFFVIFFIFLYAINFWVIWIRRTLPRIRFDKFIQKAWKLYIPIMTIFILLIILAS